MAQRMIRQVLASLAAVIGATLVACGGAPNESTSGEQGEEMRCKPPLPCGCTRIVDGRCCPPGFDCKPPPPETVSNWSAIGRFGVSGSSGNMTCPNSTFAMLAKKYETIKEYGVVATRNDPVGAAAMTLMNPSTYNCSTPVRWYTEDPEPPPGMMHPQPCPANAAGQRIDLAWMHAVMCPIGGNSYQTVAKIQGVLAGIAQTTAPGECWQADRKAFVSTKACDAELPAPPSGYVWAVLSMDPTCNGTGCMIQSSGGPEQW